VGGILVAELVVLVLIAWAASSGPSTGVAVQAKAASISMGDQRNVIHDVTVDRVDAPSAGWLVVQADWEDKIAEQVLGSVWIPAGQSREVKIPLDQSSSLPRRIFVTLLADKGNPKVLEYATGGMDSGMKSSATAADVPVIAGGEVVRAHVGLAPLSFAVGGGQAALSEATRTADATSVVFARVVAPAQSWISVSIENASGRIGQVLGTKLVRPGTSVNVNVPIAAVPPGAQVVVATLHVDLGTVGQFDYSPSDIGNSYDQPYVAGGQTVSVGVPLAPPSRK
jgi:hypothetical protein